jgi:hypothetical protein
MTRDEPRLREALQELVDAQPFEPDPRAIARRGRSARRRAEMTRSVAGVGLAAVVAAVLVVSGAISTHPGSRGGSLTIGPGAAAQSGPLVRLAADINTNQMHQPGDATLITSMQITRFGEHYRQSERLPGAELFTDAGEYYVASLDPPSDKSYTPRSDTYYLAHPVVLLRAEIAAHRTVSNRQFANEQAAAINAAEGNVAAARRQMAEASPLVGKRALSTRPGQLGLVPVEAWIWDNSEQALEKGAGNPQVRAGVLRLLATLPDVTVTHTITDSRSTLTLRAGRPEAGMTDYQSLVIDAHTGTPVTWNAGPGTQPPETTVTYHVRRVTVSAFTAEQP